MANGYPTAAGGLNQGLLGGLQTGLAIGQAHQNSRLQDQQLAEQKRQADFEKGYKSAALAIQVAGIPGIPDEMKARALNNGFLPLWNNQEFDVAGNNKTPLTPFTADSFQDKELQKVIAESKRLAMDKDLAKNPELQMQAVTGLWMDYHGKKGKEAEAQKLALDLVKGKDEKSGEVTKIANDLRQEFINRPEVKEYVTVATQVKSMDSLLNKAMAGEIKGRLALDQALITMYNKINDPIGTVRESEYARTPENLALINRMQGAIDKISSGGAGLTNEDRKALVFGAKVIANERGRQFNQTRSGYEELAGKMNADTSLVTGTIPSFGEFDLSNPNAGGGGKPKTIQQGGFTYTLNEQTGEYE